MECFFIKDKNAKAGKRKACSTFPVLERKGKAANYRFAVGVKPCRDSQVRKSLQDSSRQESYQILETVQSNEIAGTKRTILL